MNLESSPSEQPSEKLDEVHGQLALLMWLKLLNFILLLLNIWERKDIWGIPLTKNETKIKNRKKYNLKETEYTKRKKNFE